MVLSTKLPWLNKHIEYISPSGKAVDGLLNTYPYCENEELAGVYTISTPFDKIIALSKSTPQEKLIFHKRLNKKNGTHYDFDSLIGNSKAFQETISMAQRFAHSKSTILIYGETGTGKELFAQSIHNASGYANGPFIPVNVSAIPETLLERILFGSAKGVYTGAIDSCGLFEEAEDGTLFLDEINSMSILLQTKILRALQEKEIQRLGESKRRRINCRIICATNKEPHEAVRDGNIRSDLFYRISAATLIIPPLRSRIEDVDDLIAYYIKKFNIDYGMNVKQLADSLMEIFHQYHWPGNVRELEHMIERAMSLADTNETILTEKHFPLYLQHTFAAQKDLDFMTIPLWQSRKTGHEANDSVSSPISLKDAMESFEKNLICNALLRNNGNITHTSNELKVLRQTLYYKIDKYKIDIKLSL